MTWINYENINQITESNSNGCQFCIEDKRNYLIKKGSLVDNDLLFLTYISFVQNNNKIIEIGSYPFNGADLLYCKNCNSNYYRYFNEGSIGGRLEYGIIENNLNFDKEKASCSITLSLSEISQLSEKFEIVDFQPHKTPVKHIFRIESSSLPPLLSVNQREMERGSLIRYDLAGNRHLLQKLITSAEGLGKRGKYRKYTRLNKKLFSFLEQGQFEKSIDLADGILKRVRKEISNAVHDLDKMEYLKREDKIVEYEKILDQIKVSYEAYSIKIPKLIGEIKACSQQSV